MQSVFYRILKVRKRERKNPYFRYVKTSILAIMALFFTADLTAQVILRNDFVIKGRHKIRNLGLSSITINLGRYPNFNQLVNGRGGRPLVIDVRALRGRKAKYTYTELAEKVYVPPVFTGPVTQKVPAFLLVPPRVTKLHLQSFPARQ
jgi:hypothetical protein